MDEKRNILIVTNSGDRGGMEAHVLNILEGLNTEFNFFVACPYGNIVSEYQKYAKVINISPKLDVDPLFIFRLIRLIRSIEISVLHTHELKAGVNGLIAASFAKVPLRISHQHTPISSWQVSKFKKTINKFVYKFVVNKLSTFEVALTEEIEKQKMKEGINEQKLVIIPNGIDLKKLKILNKLKEKYNKEIRQRYGVGGRDLIIGNISRLTVEKGHAVLIKAIRELENEGKLAKVRFIIVGDGVLRNELERTVKSYGLSEKIIFTGFVSEEEKLKLLNSFDIFVFPSLAEGFGIAAIEAMALHLPSVLSDLPVLKDVCGDSVLYFEQGNVLDLKVKLEEMISNKKLREELSIKAGQRVKDYSIEKFWDKYKKLYSSF